MSEKVRTVEEIVNGFVDHLRNEWEEGRWNGPDYQKRLTEVLLSFARQETELLEEALEAYQANYPCPGFEVGIGAGEFSGCSGGEDCPVHTTLAAHKAKMGRE